MPSERALAEALRDLVAAITAPDAFKVKIEETPFGESCQLVEDPRITAALRAARAALESASNGTPDERSAAMRKRARALVERDPVQALANIATALAHDEIEGALRERDEARATVERERDQALAAAQALVDEARAALVKLHGALYQDDVPRRRAIAEAGALIDRWAKGDGSSPTWHREHHGDGRWTDRQVVGEPAPGGSIASSVRAHVEADGDVTAHPPLPQRGPTDGA